MNRTGFPSLVRPFGPLPPLAGSRVGPAIVAGTAPGALDEYDAAHAAARAMGAPHVPVLGVNGFGFLAPRRTDHWISLHPEAFFPHRGPEHVAATHSDKHMPGVDVVWPLAVRGGGSALLAVCIGLAMGFGPLILCGVHLDGYYRAMRGRWLELAPAMAGRVGSVSPKGTSVRDLLGGPSPSAAASAAARPG